MLLTARHVLPHSHPPAQRKQNRYKRRRTHIGVQRFKVRDNRQPNQRKERRTRIPPERTLALPSPFNSRAPQSKHEHRKHKRQSNHTQRRKSVQIHIVRSAKFGHTPLTDLEIVFPHILKCRSIKSTSSNTAKRMLLRRIHRGLSRDDPRPHVIVIIAFTVLTVFRERTKHLRYSRLNPLPHLRRRRQRKQNPRNSQLQPNAHRHNSPQPRPPLRANIQHDAEQHSRRNEQRSSHKRASRPSQKHPQRTRPTAKKTAPATPPSSKHRRPNEHPERTHKHRTTQRRLMPPPRNPRRRIRRRRMRENLNTILQSNILNTLRNHRSHQPNTNAPDKPAPPIHHTPHRPSS